MVALEREHGCIREQRGSMAALEREHGCIREGPWLH